MKKTFVTIFPYTENSHLIKDIGQVPYFMQQLYNYQSSLVTYKISKEYSHLEGEVKGLKLEFINNIGQFLFLEKGILRYLLKNSKHIDTLNLYHFTKHTFVYGILYKWLNPKGFLYIKLDAYNETFKSEITHSKIKTKNAFLKKLERVFLKKVNLFSIENTEGEKLFKLLYPETANKIIYLPNGVNDSFLKKNFKTINDFETKENIIITTGRIGLTVKNHEMILIGLTKVDLKDWKMYFVGPVEKKFLDFYSNLSVDFPKLKTQVVFTGEVLDRKIVYEWYNKAKIFCLTSPFESFGISLIEATYFGNYIIGTEGISSFDDITNQGAFGKKIKLNDYEGFSSALQKLIDNVKIMESCFNKNIEYNQQHFLWSKITDRLNNEIKKHSEF